jgi:phage shock protein PspC (stress-responsive transcriptional regulator)
MQVNPRRLYRSRDRQLAGVAGGMAEYLDIDPTIVRILWILAAILSVGFVILAYIVLAVVMPENPYPATGSVPGGQPGYGSAGQTAYGPTAYGPSTYGQSTYGPTAYGQAAYGQAGPTAGATGWAAPAASPAWSPDWAARPAAAAQATPQSRGRRFGAAAIVGVVLIVIGAIALADAALPGWSSAVVLGPAVILALGAALLVASIRRNDEPAAAPASNAPAADAPVGPAAPDSTVDPVATYTSTDTQPVDPASLA